MHNVSLPRACIVTGLLLASIIASSEPAFGAETKSADRAISRCIKTISKSQGTVNEKKKVELDFYCPGLPARINRLPLAKKLSYRFDTTSSIAELKDLRHFIAEPASGQLRRYQFDYSRVKGIVDSVSPHKPDAKPGLWNRFWSWVKSFFPARDKKQNDKLENIFQTFKLSKNARDVVTYVSSAIIVILALWVVLREWIYFRRAGSAVRSKRTTMLMPGGPEISGPIGLGDVKQLPPLYQLPALLHWSIEYCIGKGELPPDQSLTSREMLRILDRNNSEYVDYFNDVVRESEKVVYGNKVPDKSVLGNLLSSADSLDDLAQGRAT